MIWPPPQWKANGRGTSRPRFDSAMRPPLSWFPCPKPDSSGIDAGLVSFSSIVVQSHGGSVEARPRAVGAVFATATAVAWGGQFVVGKSALGSVNAFPLSTI